MDTSLFTALLASEQILVLQREPGGAFRILGQSPAWFESFDPVAATHSAAALVRDCRHQCRPATDCWCG